MPVPLYGLHLRREYRGSPCDLWVCIGTQADRSSRKGLHLGGIDFGYEHTAGDILHSTLGDREIGGIRQTGYVCIAGSVHRNTIGTVTSLAGAVSRAVQIGGI
jgi:hypothetical protein